MASNVITERGKALESAFFRSEDAKLLDRLRREATKEVITEAFGIQDQKALDTLIDCGVTASTLTAISLVPLIFVAWADRMMNDREREAVLKATPEAGIKKGGDAYSLIEYWLSKRPPKSLMAAWEQYVEATLAEVDEAGKEELRHTSVDRARKVAEATGGFLGVATTSAVEREVLSKIESAFA